MRPPFNPSSRSTRCPTLDALQPDPHIRSFGHLALPVDPRAWAPQLVLEPEGPSPVIQSVLESRLKLLEVIGGHQLRPYSLRFELPPGLASATCFRVSWRCQLASAGC